MNAQPIKRCDTERLDALLRGTLSQAEAADVEAHLSTCQACAERIQLAAVTETSWDEAQSLLSLDEFDGLSSLAAASSLFPSDADDHVDSPTKDLLSREISGWLDPTDDPTMLGRFAGYEIVGIIGHGGMGIVLKGFERSLNRYVAIKILAPRLATNGSARKRFAREAQAAAAVRHDNVIAIHRVDEWHGLPFLTMPYVGGVSLQKRIDREGPLSIEQTLRVGVQIAAGLAAAHAQGLVHRDIKPANILLEQGVERVTITDFGLARAADDASVTRTGVIAGTPQYMSPEQAEAKQIDARSDLFSLGSVLYTMSTGRPPFRGEGSFDVLKRIVNEPARCMREIEPKVPDWFECVVNRLHAKSPNERPQSAEAVAGLLEDCLAHIQQPTTAPLPESIAALAPQQSRRPPIVRFIAAAAFAFSLIFAGVLIVLELNKGTLTIESEADDVPIRIMQGDKVVEQMTVTKSGESIRIAAGNYIVEIDGQHDGLNVEHNAVTVMRGKTQTARVIRDTEAISSAAANTSPAHVATAKNLTRLMDALHRYHKEKGRFPMAVTPGGVGLSYSWRVELLPWLGHQALYDQYHFDEPWYSPRNKLLLAQMPDVFRSPMDAADSTHSSYFGVTSNNEPIGFGVASNNEPTVSPQDSQQERAGGLGHSEEYGSSFQTYANPAGGTPVELQRPNRPQGTTLFWKNDSAQFRDFLEGTSHTIALVEAKRAIPWTQPLDIEYSAGKSLPEFGVWFAEGWFVGFADGKVKFLSRSNDEQTIQSLLMIYDGNAVTPKLVSGLETGEGSLDPTGSKSVRDESHSTGVPVLKDTPHVGRLFSSSSGVPVGRSSQVNEGETSLSELQGNWIVDSWFNGDTNSTASPASAIDHHYAIVIKDNSLQLRETMPGIGVSRDAGSFEIRPAPGNDRRQLLIRLPDDDPAPGFGMFECGQDRLKILLCCASPPKDFAPNKDAGWYFECHRAASEKDRKILEYMDRTGEELRKLDATLSRESLTEQQINRDGEELRKLAATEGWFAINRLDPRVIADAYIAAAVWGNSKVAASLAWKNPAVPPAGDTVEFTPGAERFPKVDPASVTQIEDIARVIGDQRHRVQAGYSNELSKPMLAMVVTEPMKLKHDQQAGVLVISLIMSGNGWLVSGIDCKPKDSADDDVKEFHEAHPSAVGFGVNTNSAQNDKDVGVPEED